MIAGTPCKLDFVVIWNVSLKLTHLHSPINLFMLPLGCDTFLLLSNSCTLLTLAHSVLTIHNKMMLENVDTFLCKSIRYLIYHWEARFPGSHPSNPWLEIWWGRWYTPWSKVWRLLPGPTPNTVFVHIFSAVILFRPRVYPIIGKLCTNTDWVLTGF